MSRIVSLSEAGSIAIHSMVLIARAKEPLNAIRIAEMTGSSRHHIAKILQRLVKEGFISSARGPKGGFEMKQDPGKILFLEIYETIEGKIERTKCPLAHPICGFENCILENVVTDMTDSFIDYMTRHKLSDFV